jgi:cystathionine beta-lyase
LFGVELAPVAKAALAAFFDGLECFGIGYSWGGYESLIVPAHFRRSVSPFPAQGPLLRIHAGLEDANDLLADLANAFARMQKQTTA